MIAVLTLLGVGAALGHRLDGLWYTGDIGARRSIHKAQAPTAFYTVVYAGCLFMTLRQCGVNDSWTTGSG